MDNPLIKALLKAVGITIGTLIANGIMMWVWNMIMPELFGCKTITYWQMFGLHMICNYLFKTHNIWKKDTE